MKKIIILAGYGLLPKLIVKKCKLRKISFNILQFYDDEKILNNSHSKKVTFGNVLTNLKRLQKEGFNKILMAGSIQRPNLKDLKPDLNSIKLIPKFIKKIMEGGDNNLLTLVINELENNGFKILISNFFTRDLYWKRKSN